MSRCRSLLFLLSLVVSLTFVVVDASRSSLITAHGKHGVDPLAAFAKSLNTTAATDLVPCTCGVFLNGQFKKGSAEQPKGNPALQSEIGVVYPCNTAGFKLCQNRCLDSIVKHLPNSPAIICGSIDRDLYKERAYLFIKNCGAKWTNTNLSAGREYCCKNGEFYKCPLH